MGEMADMFCDSSDPFDEIERSGSGEGSQSMRGSQQRWKQAMEWRTNSDLEERKVEKMTKVIGRIERYEGNNVVVGGMKYFIPSNRLVATTTTFPVGTVIALDTLTNQKSTVDWIRGLTKAELAGYEKGNQADPLPDPAFKTGKEILQENLEKAVVPPVSKVPTELDREREEYNARAKEATKPDPAPVTELVTVLPRGSPTPKTYTSDEMILLRNVIAKGCTEPEFKLMMYMAAQYGLDPLLKQIWAVKRNEKSAAIIFVGRDGMLAIAHRSGKFDGMNSGVTYEKDKDGKEHPVTAWCEIWRKDMTHSFKTEVRFDEYVQPVPISGYQGLWQTKPSVMIIKVAESVCLRKAFSVSGLYSPEEIGDPQ